ncbi:MULTISPECIES: flagellar hook-length control protein FliK [unclassified Azospirillum]|uniref:flagellar hook-length control protein FliK n=1 Tax=unclassified Azospirillum TaxID=2630922 RepID=UPI000B678195|nr:MULTISPECIES: flagellar hook-length control protein FliK [unclassified Azospirillum]SNS45860.1 Flagellar hook-length control protein FliK [Azospirillum sp. RU38E]SNS64959.1 Flagellar hook-length control protein FliK [Azospirillum sp. RU37A]
MPPLNAIPVPAVSLEGGAIAPGRTLPGAAGPASGVGFDALIASLLGGAAPAPDGVSSTGTAPDKNSAPQPARPDQTAEGASLAAALMQLAGWQSAPQPAMAQQAPAGTDASLDISPVTLPAASTPPGDAVPAVPIPSVPAAPAIPVSDAMSPPQWPAGSAIPPQAEGLEPASLLPGSLPVSATPPFAALVQPETPAPVPDTQPVTDNSPSLITAPSERLAAVASSAVAPSDRHIPPRLTGTAEASIAVDPAAEAVAVATPVAAIPPAAAAPADTPRLRPARAAAPITADGDPRATDLPGLGDASAVPAPVKSGKAADGDDPAGALRPAPQGAGEQPAPVPAPAPVAAARPDPLPEPAAAFPADQPATSAVTAAREVAASTGPQAARRASASHLSPAAQLTGRIEQAVSEGRTTLTVRLDPETLGRVEVKLELQDGRVTAHIAAERPATLDLLQRDARLLERAVEQGGLQLSGGGLQFSLREGAGQWAEAQAGNRRGGLAYGMAASEPVADPLSPTLYTSDSLVDIQI